MKGFRKQPNRAGQLTVLFVFIVLIISVWHISQATVCYNSGGVYTRVYGALFYSCENDDLRLEWRK